MIVRETDVVFSFARTKDFKHDPKSVAFKNLDDSQKSKLSESEAAQQRELVEWFPYTPAMFWTRTCVDHNGFFGIHTSSENAPTSGKTTNPSPKPSPASSSANQTGTSSTNHSGAGHQHTVSTHFRLIVKILKESQGSQQQDPTSSAPGKKEKEYKWHEMGFMSFSSNSRSTILCFDVPDSVITGLEDTLTSAEQYGGPFGLHVPLLEELVKLYDGSVWGMAKKVREIEEVS